MKFGKVLAALLGAAGLLVAPATAAQASTAPTATSACAPTDDVRWVGSFNGPHTDEGDGGRVYNRQVDVFKQDGQLWIKFYGGVYGSAQAWADTDTGLLRTSEPNHPFMFLASASATCDAGGDVVGFSGEYRYHYFWPECFSCVVWGTFDVTRTAAVRS